MAKRIDPAQQYSKKLSRLTATFWTIYSLLVIVVMLIRPEAAEYAFWAGLPVHVIQVVNLCTYMYNSTSEKRIYSYEFVADWISKYTGKGIPLPNSEDGDG